MDNRRLHMHAHTSTPGLTLPCHPAFTPQQQNNNNNYTISAAQASVKSLHLFSFLEGNVYEHIRWMSHFFITKINLNTLLQQGNPISSVKVGKVCFWKTKDNLNCFFGVNFQFVTYALVRLRHITWLRLGEHHVLN